LLVKFILDLRFVSSERLVELLVFRVLLDGADGPDGGSLRSNLVLESNRKQVSLLSAEVFRLGGSDSVKEINHIVESLGLLSNSGHENVFF